VVLVKPRFETRAKVRVGIKNARGLPESVDYFVCDDPEFVQLYPGRPRQLEVVMPYAEAASVFDQSLEAWKGSVLACHSQDGQRAKRRTHDGVTFSAGAEPMPIPCPFRSCDWFERRDCKVTGRLRFFLAGGADRSRVLCLDTHAYGSIETIGAATQMAERLGQLQLAQGRLTVEMVRRDRKQFPLVSLYLAAAAVQETSDLDELKAILRAEGRYDDPAARAWVERVGVEAALAALRARGNGR
jgi:hypothetical protein